jgi:glycosyltransferase involved in cell wall biosynthesis
MVSSPSVSILMPTHSRVDVIGFAIESVLAQTVEDFELLVIGDGCAAGTAEAVAGYRDPRIRFFDLPKAPAFGYANRNVAAREARGKFIGFAADDDLLFPDHLEVLLDGLKGGGPLAYSQALWVSTDGVAAPFMTNLTAADELAIFMEHRNSIPASCFLYRADCLPGRDVWAEDVESSADWILWRRIIRENPDHPLFYSRAPTVLHFSAKRMASRYARMPEFATELAIADRATWWPTPLRVPVPDGKTEQDVYASLMRADPKGWSERVRSSTADLIARLAWEDIQTARPHIALMEEKLSALQSELTITEDRATVAKGALTRAEGEILQAQNSIEELSEMLAAADGKVDAQLHEIQAMRSTIAWKLHEWLKRLLSAVGRKQG